MKTAIDFSNCVSFLNTVRSAWLGVLAMFLTLPVQATEPNIATQPESQVVIMKSNATFSVVATGDEPLSYQWWKNETNILTDGGNVSGAATATLTITNVQFDDSGDYQVIVTNAFGSVTSSVARLTMKWKFVVYGDSRGTDAANQINTNILTELARVTTNEKPAFVLFPGDLVYSGSQAAFQGWTNLMSPVYQAGIEVYPVLGNHDANAINDFTGVFHRTLPDNGPSGETYRTYAITYNDVLVLALDEYANPHRVNQSWINSVLATNTRPHVFAFGHEPAFKAGGHADCLDDYPSARDAFWNSLRNVGGHAYFACHEHFYDHARVDDGDGDVANDIHQIIVGTAGAPLESSYAYDGVNSGWTPTNVAHEKQYGYLAVEICGDDITTTWYHRTAPDVYTAAFTYALTGPPLISRQPSSRTNIAGTSATFTVVASGTTPLHYQWLLDSASIGEATNRSYTLAVVHTNDAGSYSVVVSNVFGSVTSSPALLVVNLETNKPAVAITSPADKSAHLTNQIVVIGKASDGVLVDKVLVSVNDDAYGLVASPLVKSCNWTNLVTLPKPGTNTVSVKAVDSSGNESAIVSRKYFLQVPWPLTLVTKGNGTVKPDLNTSNLVITKSYTLTATPGINYLFSNWLASVDGGPTNVATNTAKYTFVMQTNLTLIANFVTNRFLGAAGTYYGLFSEEEVAQQSAGLFKLTVKASQGKPGTFSGKLYVDGDILSMFGVFDLSGWGTSKPVVRKGKDPLMAWIGLDLENDMTNSIVVSNANSWGAAGYGNRAVFNNTNHPASDYVGAYTMVIPGTAGSTTNPAGDSYATVTVASNGTIKATGALAEDAGSKAVALSPVSVSVSQDGNWPFYAGVYPGLLIYANGSTVLTNKENKGSVLGWLSFNPAPARDLSGTLYWLKPGWTNQFYPEGFTNEIAILGSAYQPPAKGQRAINVVTGAVAVADGNLSGPFTNRFVLNTNNGITLLAPNVNTQKLALTTTSGLLKGQFNHPQNNNLKTPIAGVVLKDLNVGRGFFLGTNQSGSFMLESE